jgi:hypothetical protein
MSEQYRKNVQAMCDRIGISNDPKIRDEDVKIYSVKIYQIGLPGPIEIMGVDTNRASRVYLQEVFCGKDEGFLSADFKQKAAAFFAELWEDAESAGRPLLIALKNPFSYLIKIQWK